MAMIRYLFEKKESLYWERMAQIMIISKITIEVNAIVCSWRGSFFIRPMMIRTATVTKPAITARNLKKAMFMICCLNSFG